MFPTPEAFKNPDELTATNRRVYGELVELIKRKQLDPTRSSTFSKSFLANFQWSKSILTVHEKERVDELFVQIHYVFAHLT